MLEREQALLFLPIDEDLRFWLNRIPIDIFTETLLTLQNHIIQYTNTKKNKSISPLNVQLGPWYRDREKTFKNKQASCRKRRLVISLNDINGWNWLLICMWSHFNGNNSFHIIPQMRLVDMIAFFSPIKIV